MEFCVLLFVTLSALFSAHGAPLLPPLADHGLNFSGSGDEDLQAIVGLDRQSGSGDHLSEEGFIIGDGYMH